MSDYKWLNQFAGGIKGLAYLHRNNISHSDFKLPNVTVGKKGGVLIDIGSTVNKKDIGKKVQIKYKHGEQGAYYVDAEGKAKWVPQDPRFTDSKLLAASVDGRLPLDAADKYSVGKSIMDFLDMKGYEVNADSPKHVKELHALAHNLINVKKHPYKYKNNDPKNGLDPRYVSLQDLPATLSKIAIKFKN
ncbi:hypothetical protein ACFLZH_05585 [Patescibacteria group bacterium]